MVASAWVNGTGGVGNVSLMEYIMDIKDLMANCISWLSVTHVSRSSNAAADFLAKQGAIVVSFALNRLTDFLIQEAAFLGRVRKEVQWLKDELEWMQCYIASAEEKQADDPIVRKWLNDITKIAYDAEDVIDKFIRQVHDEETKERKQPDDQDTNKETKPTGCFPSMSSCVKCKKKVNLPEKVVNLHDIGNDIEELKIRINDLIRKRELYQLESSSNKGEGNSSNSLATLRQLRRTTSFSIEKKVVGHDDGTTRLLAKLLNQDRRRFVVSIYGMGGLGKTTLAGKLYHHLDVKRKFDCHAWVCVSQDYNIHDLLLRIIISFGFTTKKTEELKHMNEEGLERYLHESLQGRSHLLVADDIWKKEAWLSFKRAFPDCNNGSRVIITTRSQEVAEDSDERTYVHKLRFLTFDESWQLFCEKAFGNPDANGVEKQLKTLGMETVQKCKGVASRVRSIAEVVRGLSIPTDSKLRIPERLRSTPPPSEWESETAGLNANLTTAMQHLFYLLRPFELYYFSHFLADSESAVLLKV
ncbi:hypothetical protein EZV62_006861 [Acer yangbiense]|uniref:NB-ARC domain-containing protein n=1 Tax=Acer yangbiense TaxID=1000413 RepID=A0A5C7IB14_9ROSI|nr:hypothetical protein EZV62_006861 [Acer yangbiense]